MTAPATPGGAEGIEVTHEPEIPVRLVQLLLCDPCLDGVGEQCHTPGCSLWIHDVPKPALRGSQGVTILGPALEPFMTRERYAEHVAAQQPQASGDAGTATAVYLEAINILAAGLRDIRDANPDAPAGGYARDRAVLALTLTDHVRPGPCPGCESLRRQCSELAGEVGMLAGALTGIRDNDHPHGSYSRDRARAALDVLHGLTVPEKP